MENNPTGEDVSKMNRQSVNKEKDVKTAEISDPLETIRNLSARNRHLEDFCFIIAHNLRTPVASLENLCELVLDTDSIAEAREYSDRMHKVTSFLHDTLEDLVQVLESPDDHNMKYESVSMGETLEKIIDLMQFEIAEANAIISANFDSVPLLNYPARYLESIFINLLSNALKYSMEDHAPLINIWSSVKDGWISLDFKDNGRGIDLEKYGKELFMFGKSFHGHKDSRGIGLFMLKSQIESLGGRISVSGAENAGLHFHLKLLQVNGNI
jgi:signal transduction histidine kinase